MQNHEKSSSKYIQICNELGSHVYNYKNLIDEFDNYSEIKDLFFVNFSKNYKSFNYTNNLILIRKLIDDLFEEKTKSLIRSCWVEKTPSNFYFFDIWNQIYKDIIFILPIRSPIGIYNSIKQLDNIDKINKEHLDKFIQNYTTLIFTMYLKFN